MKKSSIKKILKQSAKVTEAAREYIAARDCVTNEEDESGGFSPIGSEEYSKLQRSEDFAYETLNDEVEKFNELVEDFQGGSEK